MFLAAHPVIILFYRKHKKYKKKSLFPIFVRKSMKNRFLSDPDCILINFDITGIGFCHFTTTP